MWQGDDSPCGSRIINRWRLGGAIVWAITRLVCTVSYFIIIFAFTWPATSLHLCLYYVLIVYVATPADSRRATSPEGAFDSTCAPTCWVWYCFMQIFIGDRLVPIVVNSRILLIINNNSLPIEYFGNYFAYREVFGIGHISIAITSDFRIVTNSLFNCSVTVGRSRIRITALYLLRAKFSCC